MPQLFSTTVTLLFSDVEGSTLLLQRVSDEYARILAELQFILREAFEQYHGRLVDTQGDTRFVVFPRAQDDVQARMPNQNHSLKR
jgi:class 3 adenylate cyclase